MKLRIMNYIHYILVFGERLSAVLFEAHKRKNLDFGIFQNKKKPLATEPENCDHFAENFCFEQKKETQKHFQSFNQALLKKSSVTIILTNLVCFWAVNASF